MGWGLTEKLLNLVSLIEDHGGADFHDHSVGARIHGVVPELLLLAIDQDRDNAALNRNVDYSLFNGDLHNRLCCRRAG